MIAQKYPLWRFALIAVHGISTTRYAVNAVTIGGKLAIDKDATV